MPLCAGHGPGLGRDIFVSHFSIIFIFLFFRVRPWKWIVAIQKRPGLNKDTTFIGKLRFAENSNIAPLSNFISSLLALFNTTAVGSVEEWSDNHNLGLFLGSPPLLLSPLFINQCRSTGHYLKLQWPTLLVVVSATFLALATLSLVVCGYVTQWALVVVMTS